MTQQAIDFVKAIFGNTEHPVHFNSLGNERDGKHSTRTLATRNPDEVTNFIKKFDIAERGLFACVSTMKPGSHKRNKDNASELPTLFADIDLKDVAESVDEVIGKLGRLKYPPSMIVRSGNGVHGYWMLTEAVMVQDEGERDRIEADLRQLADLVGGDLQVCEVARLMRLPGTHNTKNGEFKEVVIEPDPCLKTYDLGDLEDWLGETSPIILRKARERAVTAGQAVETDPYLAYFKEEGLKAPIDIKAMLDGMMYMGGEEHSIHGTQISVSSAMINRSYPDEEIVEALMAATRAAAGDYGKRWNWRYEERTIRKEIATWHVKLAKEGKTPKLKLVQQPAPKAATSIEPTPSAEVISMAKARTALAIKPKPDAKPDDANHIKIGAAVIGVIRGRGDDLIFTEKASWSCKGGLWRMMTDTAWLNVEIEKAVQALNYASNNKLVSEVRGWIQRQESLWRDEVAWDQHGMVPTRSGLVDPRTLEVTPLRADHYATWRIECEYDKDAICPWWLQMLEDVFEDRVVEERAATISIIQELLGAGLIDDKPREITRALIFQGGSNFGKSGLIEVLGGLFGQDQNSTPIEALEGTHGLMPFVRRMPWVLHEAFDQRKWHFSSSVKAIITGEPVGVNIKNGPLLSIRVRSPIFWGTNHPPQFKESTKAITNRLVVIECRREFFPEEPVGAAIEAAARGLAKPSSLVLRDEMPGVLAWALQGVKRALERGYLQLTNEMIEINEAIRDDSNLVAGFLNECVIYDQDRRVSAPDFCLAFGAWWLANKGESRQVPSNESIGKNLLAMADSMIAINHKELRDNTRRYYAGIALNEEGLAFHVAGSELRELAGKTANATEPKGIINSPIPAAWGNKPSIVAMRKRSVTVGGDRLISDFPKRSPVTEIRDRSAVFETTVTELSPERSPEQNATTSRSSMQPNF